MTIGAGITLIVLGLIFLLGVIQVDIPFIGEYGLGLLLTLAGLAGILLTMWSRNRPWGTTPAGERVVERHVERGVSDPVQPRVIERHYIERDDGSPPPL
jgi:hypothetical protein